jgi:uncharacterized protein YcbX
MAVGVVGLALTPVKGTRLQAVERIDLLRTGARGNRRFFVVDELDRMVNSKTLGELQTVVSECLDDQLRLTFPDGSAVHAEVTLGEPVSARFFSRTVEGRALRGPWGAALSEHLGQAVRLVEAEGSVDRGPRGAASLISRASLAQLAEVASEPSVDPRRFRMLIEIDGVAANAEDAWVGRSVRVGDAVIRWCGHVGRCLITSRDPDTGVIDLPTLDILGDYRRELNTTEPLPFGIYGEVAREGSVSVGDEVALT